MSRRPNSMPLEAVYVKEEPDDAGSQHGLVEEEVELMDEEDCMKEEAPCPCRDSEGAALAGLYTSHLLEDDLMLDTERPQHQMAPRAIVMEPRARACTEQYLALIQFMERHGDIARLPLGVHGRMRSDSLWQELEPAINGVAGGVYKPIEKWKKVWADWKTKTKKKAFDLRKNGNGTGLNMLERRVLGVMRLRACAARDEVDDAPMFQPAPRPPPAAPAPAPARGDGDARPEGADFADGTAPSPPEAPASSPPPLCPSARARARAPRSAFSALVALEHRRLALEERRERRLQWHGARRLRLEAARLRLLRHLAGAAKGLLQHWRGRGGAD